MRVLLIKTSSMGDIIHTLPALTDASKAHPAIQFDWVVEEAFTELPKHHPQVQRVIPVALRRLRKNFFSYQTLCEWITFIKQLRKTQYDLILDAQGLIKSAWLAQLAKGVKAGLDYRSAREALASFFYQRKYKVNFYQHAITRMRLLFSLALDYPLPNTPPDINFMINNQKPAAAPYIVFLHGTTWKTKEWPESYWGQLADIAHQFGLSVKLSGGKAEEIARAYRIAHHRPWVEVLPSLSIVAMSHLLKDAAGAVAVDTGFGHLASALAVPLVSLYGATLPSYTGAMGPYSLHLASHFPCSPCLKKTCTYRNALLIEPACYSLLPPSRVWLALENIMQTKKKDLLP